MWGAVRSRLYVVGNLLRRRTLLLHRRRNGRRYLGQSLDGAAVAGSPDALQFVTLQMALQLIVEGC